MEETRSEATLGAPALQIPRLLRPAEIVCSDGRVLRGRIFLPAAPSSLRGAMPVAEWVEEAAPFFPFLPDGAGSPVLLNKEGVVAISVAGTDAGEAKDPSLPRRRVRVDCGALEIAGEVVVEMPPTHSRVLDVLNGPGTFLLIASGARGHLLRKSRIVRVTQPEGAVEA